MGLEESWLAHSTWPLVRGGNHEVKLPSIPHLSINEPHCINQTSSEIAEHLLHGQQEALPRVDPDSPLKTAGTGPCFPAKLTEKLMVQIMDEWIDVQQGWEC